MTKGSTDPRRTCRNLRAQEIALKP